MTILYWPQRAKTPSNAVVPGARAPGMVMVDAGGLMVRLNHLDATETTTTVRRGGQYAGGEGRCVLSVCRASAQLTLDSFQRRRRVDANTERYLGAASKATTLSPTGASLPVSAITLVGRSVWNSRAVTVRRCTNGCMSVPREA